MTVFVHEYAIVSARKVRPGRDVESGPRFLLSLTVYSILFYFLKHCYIWMTVSGRCSVSEILRVAACVIFTNFPELRRIATGRLVPIKNFGNLGLSATVRAAVGHFIAKTRSLEDGREDGKDIKDCSPEWGGRHQGRQRRKGGGSGALMDRSTEVFRCIDGQRQSAVWSCAVPREGINPIAAQIPMFADGY
jgi:hypothetical protein